MSLVNHARAGAPYQYPDPQENSPLAPQSDEHPYFTSGLRASKVELDIMHHVRELQSRLGLPNAPWMPPPRSRRAKPIFFLEITPRPKNKPVGAICKLPGCEKQTIPGDCRIAVAPSMGLVDNGNHNVGSNKLISLSNLEKPFAYTYCLDTYHIGCFEQIVDFTNKDFVAQVTPLGVETYGSRKLNASQAQRGVGFLDGGALRLISEWKIAQSLLIDARINPDGPPSNARVSPELGNLLYNAGNSTFQHHPVTPVDGWDFYTQHLYVHELAPNESGGPGDQLGWNLFDNYLVAGPLEDRHTLSRMLESWKRDKRLPSSSDKDLSKDAGQCEAGDFEITLWKADYKTSTLPPPALRRRQIIASILVMNGHSAPMPQFSLPDAEQFIKKKWFEIFMAG